MNPFLLTEVAEERNRQDARWGEQNHPSVRTDISYDIPSEANAKLECNEAFDLGYGSWAHIAIEELAEVVHASNDVDRRGELVQLAAVCLAWIECIDRNTGV